MRVGRRWLPPVAFAAAAAAAAVGADAPVRGARPVRVVAVPPLPAGATRCPKADSRAAVLLEASTGGGGNVAVVVTVAAVAIAAVAAVVDGIATAGAAGCFCCFCCCKRLGDASLAWPFGRGGGDGDWVNLTGGDPIRLDSFGEDESLAAAAARCAAAFTSSAVDAADDTRMRTSSMADWPMATRRACSFLRSIALPPLRLEGLLPMLLPTPAAATAAMAMSMSSRDVRHNETRCCSCCCCSPRFGDFRWRIFTCVCSGCVDVVVGGAVSLRASRRFDASSVLRALTLSWELCVDARMLDNWLYPTTFS